MRYTCLFSSIFNNLSVKLTFLKVLFKAFRSDLIKYDLFKELQSINMVFVAFVLFFFFYFI